MLQTVPVKDAGAPERSSVEASSLADVELLLDDMRTLLGYLVRGRTGDYAETVADLAAQGAKLPVVSLMQSGAIDIALLTESAQSIADNPDRLSRLYATVAQLTAVAAPATERSIRLTSALLGTRESGFIPRETVALARRQRRWLTLSGALGLVVFIASIVLMIHVDRGRGAVQQLETLRLGYQSALMDATGLRVPLRQDALGLASCAAGPASDAAQAACGRLQSAISQIAIVHDELARWNGLTQRLGYLSPLNWLGAKLGRAPSDVPAAVWDATELRTSMMMAGLTGFILPMLLGLLGACTYVYRAFDDAVQRSTLVVSEGLHGVLRILLGAILGGLLGLIWTTGQNVHVEGVNLSLGALAFLVGFNVEMVFQILTRIVQNAAVWLNRPRQPG